MLYLVKEMICVYKKIISLLALILVISVLSGCTGETENSNKIRNEYDVEGESENGNLSLEYSITERDKIWIEGEVVYTGDEAPNEVDMEFVMYDVEPTSFYHDDIGNINSTVEFEGHKFENGRINISESFTKTHDPEVYKEAIGYGYIEIEWIENGNEQTEKISLNLVE